MEMLSLKFLYWKLMHAIPQDSRGALEGMGSD